MGAKGEFAVHVLPREGIPTNIVDEGEYYENLNEGEAWSLFLAKKRTEDRVLLYRGGRKVVEFHYRGKE